MDDNRTGAPLPHRAESRLVKAATEAVKNTCANPERIDCPDAEAIQAIAARRPSYGNFDDTIDHIAMCAPCLEEYTWRRQQYRDRSRRRWVVGFAALLLLGLLRTHHPIREQRPSNQFAQKTELVPLQAATLDYSGWTAERSLSPSPTKREVPRVARARLALILLLPIGTESGRYTIQIRSASGAIVAQANGLANWTGKAEKLNIDLDVSRLPAGPYTLSVQSADASERNYPVLLE
jgi:hypothetical protein